MLKEERVAGEGRRNDGVTSPKKESYVWARRIWRFFKLNNYMWSMIYAPIIAQIILFISLDGKSRSFVYTLVAIAIAVAILGYFRSKKLEAQDGYFKTYFALFFPIVIAAINYNLFYVADIYDIAFDGANIFTMVINAVYFFSFVVLLSFYSPFHFAALVTTVSCAYAIGFAFGLYRKKIVILHKKPIYISLCAAIALLLPVAALATYKSSYMLASKVKEQKSVGEEIDYRYSPLPLVKQALGDGAIEAKLRGRPTIYFENNLPKLDGATAFCPIYASAAKALYKKPDNFDEERFGLNYFDCSATPWAYRRLIEGKVDLIFVLAPSDEQRREALETGAELTLTPIGKEAFVFLINEQNPVKSLTIEQIQKIYTGEITNWREVGGNDAKILAFQRDWNSGSQTTMENGVMKGLTLKKPLQETVVMGMGGLIDVVADYRNADSAIGYSFRFFVTGMMKAEGVRLLAINGVEPTIENIQNGSYPLIEEFYIVGKKNDISQNAQKLIDWFLSDQGQTLIEDGGYVPIKDSR